MNENRFYSSYYSTSAAESGWSGNLDGYWQALWEEFPEWELSFEELLAEWAELFNEEFPLDGSLLPWQQLLEQPTPSPELLPGRRAAPTGQSLDTAAWTAQLSNNPQQLSLKISLPSTEAVQSIYVKYNPLDASVSAEIVAQREAFRILKEQLDRLHAGLAKHNIKLRRVRIEALPDSQGQRGQREGQSQKQKEPLSEEEQEHA